METRECASLQQPRWRARLACWRSRPAIGDFSKNFFGETPKPARETRALRGNAIKKNSGRFFCTSNPPVSRGELAAEPFAPLSFFFLRRSFFAVRAGLADSGIGLQRTRTQKVKSSSASRWRMRRTGSNILAPGLRPEGLSDSSFSRLHRCSEHGQFACAPSGHYARFFASAELELRWAHRLQVCVP